MLIKSRLCRPARAISEELPSDATFLAISQPCRRESKCHFLGWTFAPAQQDLLNIANREAWKSSVPSRNHPGCWWTMGATRLEVNVEPLAKAEEVLAASPEAEDVQRFGEGADDCPSANH